MSLVYLAGPIGGLAYSEANDWREQAAEHLNFVGIETASPLRFKTFLKTEVKIQDHYKTNVLATPKAIYTRDKWDVSRSDVILVNLVGADRVSIGTVEEIGWADMLNKPIVIAMEEGNIHQHAMIIESAGYIVPTLAQALGVVEALLITKTPAYA